MKTIKTSAYKRAYEGFYSPTTGYHGLSQVEGQYYEILDSSNGSSEIMTDKELLRTFGEDWREEIEENHPHLIIIEARGRKAIKTSGKNDISF